MQTLTPHKLQEIMQQLRLETHSLEQARKHAISQTKHWQETFLLLSQILSSVTYFSNLLCQSRVSLQKSFSHRATQTLLHRARSEAQEMVLQTRLELIDLLKTSLIQLDSNSSITSSSSGIDSSKLQDFYNKHLVWSREQLIPSEMLDRNSADLNSQRLMSLEH